MGCIAFSLVLALIVNMIVSDETTTEDSPTAYDFEGLLELEKMYIRSKLIADGEKQALPSFEQMCYNAHLICIQLVPATESVCAHHQNHGLVDFPNLCELRFQNCLAEAYETRTGNKSRTGLFYYNAEYRECVYYLKKTKTAEEAVTAYFEDDIAYKIKHRPDKKK